MRRVVTADRWFTKRRRASFLAAVALGILATPATATLPTDVTAPPPASEFREGDHWRSWGSDASGYPTNSFRYFGVRDGTWYELPNDLDTYSGARDARSFEQLKDPIFYPVAPYDKQIVATRDGLLHRYVNGQWLDLPIGSTLTDLGGTEYRIDTRATAYDADQLSQVFQHGALTEHPTGETAAGPILLPSPDQLVAAQPPPPSPQTVTPATDKPAATVEAPAAKQPEAKPASTGTSLPMAILYLLIGAGGAVALVKLLGRKEAEPGA